MARGIRELVQTLLQIDGVDSALVTARDGLVIASASKIELGEDDLGAMVAMAISGAESMGKESGLGALGSCMVEFGRGKFITFSSGNAILALLTSNEAIVGNIGCSARYAMQRIARAV